jgi:ATP synthase protein I
MEEPDDGNAASFESRLQAARGRRGIDAPSAPPGSNSAAGGNPWGAGVRVGVELVSALAVAVAIGWYLDHWLHTLPLFLVVFVLLGGAAGIANVWRMVRPQRDLRKSK